MQVFIITYSCVIGVFDAILDCTYYTAVLCKVGTSFPNVKIIIYE